MGFDSIYAVLPDHAAEISRLQYLLADARLPVVSVIGKYNHGKRLLAQRPRGARAVRRVGCSGNHRVELRRA